MEKFDLEALMDAIDNAGLNTLILACPEALEISREEFIFLLNQAEWIYKEERSDESVKIVCNDLGDGRFYIALAKENEMRTL